MTQTQTALAQTQTLVGTLNTIAAQLEAGEIGPKAALDAANEALSATEFTIKRQKNAAALVKRLRAEAAALGDTLPAAAPPAPAEDPDNEIAAAEDLLAADPEYWVWLDQVEAADRAAFEQADAERFERGVGGEPGPVAASGASQAPKPPAEPPAGATAAPAGTTPPSGKAARLAALLAGEKPPAPAPSARARTSVTFREVGGEIEVFPRRIVRRALAELSPFTREVLAQVASSYSGTEVRADDAGFVDAVLDALHNKPCPASIREAIRADRERAASAASLAAPKGGAPRKGARLGVIVNALRTGATVREICEMMAAKFPTYSARHGGGPATADSFDGFVRAAISHMDKGLHFSVSARTKGKILRGKNEAGVTVYRIDPSVDLGDVVATDDREVVVLADAALVAEAAAGDEKQAAE
jgi:hypothetical protein